MEPKQDVNTCTNALKCLYFVLLDRLQILNKFALYQLCFNEVFADKYDVTIISGPCVQQMWTFSFLILHVAK